ncbi:MAG: inositol monophosphatase family protein [Patescibacteria group bacterium]
MSNYSNINGSIIGAAMRECVVKATRLIRERRFTFKPRKKGVRADGRPDWVTDADEEAQMIYQKILRERFLQFGIVGEEDGLRVECTHPTLDLWFSVDPLDGTSAYSRMQSHGIGTMIALMCDEEVIASAIGDVMTGEIYYYRPGSKKTHRLDVFQHEYEQVLSIDVKKPLIEQYLLLRDPVLKHSSRVQSLAHHSCSPFYSHEITGGSIGISMARLWKGEVGGAILRPGKQTPWDSCPVIGMSKRLGFVFFNINPMYPILHKIDLKVRKETYITSSDQLIIHESRFPELTDWCTHNGFLIDP